MPLEYRRACALAWGFVLHPGLSSSRLLYRFLAQLAVRPGRFIDEGNKFDDELDEED